MPAGRSSVFAAPVAMLALIHLSTASEPYPTQWRVRSSGLVRWDLAEFRLYSDAACRTEIPVLDNIASGRVHGDENPIARAREIAERHHFQTPLDEVDAAARILDPIFAALADDAPPPLHGKFLKDYVPVEW